MQDYVTNSYLTETLKGFSEIPTITLTAGPGVGETLSEEDYQTILDNDIIHVVITFEGNKLDFVLNKVSMYLGDDGLLFVVFIINMPKVNANFNSSYLGIVIIEALTKKATWNLKTTFIFNPGSSYVFSQKQTFNGGITVDGDLGINVGTIHLTQSALQELNTQAQKIPTIESNVSDLTTSIDNITNDYMTLSTNQTVAGQKTFTQSQTFQAGLGVNGNAGINFNDVNLNMIDVVALLNIKDNFVNLKNSNEVPQDLYIGSFFIDGDDLSLIREVGGDGSDKNNIEIVTAGTVFGVGFSNANALINSFYLKDTQHNMLVEMGVDANTFYCSFLDGIFGFNFDKTTGEYFELILNGNVLFKNITYTYTNSEENIANNAYKTIQLTSLKDENIAITSVAVTDGREPGILDGVIVSQPCWNGINWQVTLYNVSGSSITEIQLDITYHNLIK